jgi:hypothetical protein
MLHVMTLLFQQQVIPYQLSSSEEAAGRVKVSKAGRLFISASGQHVAAIDRNSLFVWAAGSSAAGKRAKPLNLPHTKAYTVRWRACVSTMGTQPSMMVDCSLGEDSVCVEYCRGGQLL